MRKRERQKLKGGGGQLSLRGTKTYNRCRNDKGESCVIWKGEE